MPEIVVTATLPTPANHHRGWTAADDAIIVAEYRKGQARSIAARLGRSHRSVTLRAGRLKVTTPRTRKAPRAEPAPASSTDVVVELAYTRDTAALTLLRLRLAWLIIRWSLGGGCVVGEVWRRRGWRAVARLDWEVG